MSILMLSRAPGPSAPAPGAEYDINDALADLPYVGFTEPTAPSITNGSATVTPATYAANVGSGKRLTLTAGSYGDLDISQNDLELLCEDGVVIGDISGGGDRVKITYTQTARNPQLGSFATFIGTDLFVGGMYLNDANGAQDSNVFGGSRCVLLNCLIRQTEYCVYLHDTANGFDFCVANCDMESSTGSGGVIRTMGWSRLVIVDSRTRNLGTGQGIRLHANDIAATNIFCARNQIERGIGFINTTGSASVGSVWYHDNTLYPETGTGNYGTTDGTAVEFRRNTMYSVGGAFPSSGSGVDVDGSNTVVSANTSAPAWSFN